MIDPDRIVNTETGRATSIGAAQKAIEKRAALVSRLRERATETFLTGDDESAALLRDAANEIETLGKTAYTGIRGAR